LKKKDQDIEILNGRLNILQTEISKVKSEKIFNEKRLSELDHLVGQLLSTNEALVAQLSGRDHPHTKSYSKYSKVSTAPLPRAVTRSTESMKAKIISNKNLKSSKINGLKQASEFILNSNVQHLKELHNIYVNMSKSLNNKNSEEYQMKTKTKRKTRISKRNSRGDKIENLHPKVQNIKFHVPDIEISKYSDESNSEEESARANSVAREKKVLIIDIYVKINIKINKISHSILNI